MSLKKTLNCCIIFFINRSYIFVEPKKIKNYEKNRFNVGTILC